MVSNAQLRYFAFGYFRECLQPLTRELWPDPLDERSRVLARILALLANVESTNSGRRKLKADRTLQTLVADLVTARRVVGMTQEDVAARMRTTKSAISRLESGRCTRPTLRTIERYALAVGASVEIRVLTR